MPPNGEHLNYFFGGKKAKIEAFQDLLKSNLSVVGMSVKDITYNSISGQLQRNIINRFRPDLMCLLSDYKNSQDIWKNFRENFNESMIHPDTKLIYR
jgi:hypothetical protein